MSSRRYIFTKIYIREDIYLRDTFLYHRIYLQRRYISSEHIYLHLTQRSLMEILSILYISGFSRGTGVRNPLHSPRETWTPQSWLCTPELLSELWSFCPPALCAVITMVTKIFTLYYITRFFHRNFCEIFSWVVPFLSQMRQFRSFYAIKHRKVSLFKQLNHIFGKIREYVLKVI